MVKVDVVVGDIGNIPRSEIELRRIDVLALGALRCKVEIGAHLFIYIVGRELNAILLSVTVIERGEDDRRTKLAFVDEVSRLLVIAVETECEFATQLLLNPDIIVICAFGEW